jgi:putative transposase
LIFSLQLNATPRQRCVSSIKLFNKEHNRRVKIRQCKYLNNIVEQDHRRIKRITRSMLVFKSFRSAQSTFAGIELVAMLNKGQMKKNRTGDLTPAKQFYALAA